MSSTLFQQLKLQSTLVLAPFHVYEGGGTVARHFTQNFGSGYRSPISIGVTDLAYEHRFVRSANNSITASTGGPFTPTNAKFTSHTGVLQLTIPNHGLDTTDTIQIATDSLVFTCSDDDFFTEQPIQEQLILLREQL